MNPALFIANYIIEFCNENGFEINNLRLQKLLYFVNVRSLIETSNPIFEDPMEMWPYGPVIPDVYHQYKSFGPFDITDNDIAGQLIDFEDFSVIEYDSSNINEHDRRLIEETVKSLSNIEVFGLVEITHKHEMWANRRNQIQSGVHHITYDNDEIIDFFNRHEEAMIWRAA